MLQDNLPGCLYLRNGRWWWRVRLPGERRKRSIQLAPRGSRFATRDRPTAVDLALEIWKRSLLSGPPCSDQAPKDLTLAGLAKLYQAHAEAYYRHPDGRPTGEAANISHGLAALTAQFGHLEAADFGPVELKRFRDDLITNDLARTTINQRVGHVRRMFRWLASEGHIPPAAAYGLAVVDGLRAGRSKAREPARVRAVDGELVRHVAGFASATVKAMVELQLLTGMRSGELVIMRPVDVDVSGEVWLYTPATHKTAWRDQSRVVAIGPAAQKVLKPFLARRVDACCFSPAEALAQHHERRGDKPGRHRREAPTVQAGDRYDRRGYYQAIRHAIRAARRAESTKPEAERLVIPDWHPHQLRHTWLTRVRSEMGTEATRASGGHRSMRMVDRYSEADIRLAVEAARRLG